MLNDAALSAGGNRSHNPSAKILMRYLVYIYYSAEFIKNSFERGLPYMTDIKIECVNICQ